MDGEPKFAQIIAMIERGIADGTYAPGARLPSESDLAARFAVSRPTAVRALDILRARGLITSQKGRGYFAATP